MNEKELIQKCLDGDEKASVDLIQQNRGKVFRHCLSIVHDEEIAEDLTQETFLHAFQHLDTFRQEAKFSTWVWRIAHNLCLNYLKKQRFVEKEFLEEIIPHFLPEKENDEEKILQIKAVMQILPEKQRIVVEMFDLQHIPQKEIAALLGISCGTVRSRIHYARKKLRQLLAKASDKTRRAKGK
jgi:RNA polymerase sigma-70 factor, ECF subfamily